MLGKPWLSFPSCQISFVSSRRSTCRDVPTYLSCFYLYLRCYSCQFTFDSFVPVSAFSPKTLSLPLFLSRLGHFYGQSGLIRSHLFTSGFISQLGVYSSSFLSIIPHDFSRPLEIHYREALYPQLTRRLAEVNLTGRHGNMALWSQREATYDRFRRI